MKSDVVIPHYGEDILKDRVVESLQTEPIERIVVVDNNKENRGFTKAVNDGIKQCSTDFIWILNNDAVVTKGALDALHKRMVTNPKCGIVSSKICELENPDRIVHAGTGMVIPGYHKNGWESNGDFTVPSKERWVTFCSVLVRAEMLKEIGLLDERFFLICSDSDLCYRARHHGWEVWYEPESKVLHPEKHGISRTVSETRNKFLEAKLGEDQMEFQRKWLGDRFKELDLEQYD